MKHLATIQAEFMKYSCCESNDCANGSCGLDRNSENKESKPKNPWAICTESTGRDSDKYEKCVKDVKKQAGVIKQIIFAGEPGYAEYFATELKRRVDENHVNDIDPNHNGASTNRSFDFHITVESNQMPQFLNCGQECPYLEYQGNPTGEYRGTPWCSLFKKDLSYNNEQGTEHPKRSSECISAVEGLM